MPIALRLALRQWLARPLRPVLCSLAIAAAVALIITVGACFESLRYSLLTSIGQMLGVAEVHVRPAQKGTAARVPGALVDTLRKRPDVELAAGRIEGQAAITKGDEHRWFNVVGIDPLLDDKLRPKQYREGRGLSSKEDELVVDSTVSDLVGLHIGDVAEFSVDGLAKRNVTVVGIIKRPAIELISKPMMYLPATVFARDLGVPLEFNVVDLKLRDVDDFEVYSKQLSKELGPSYAVTAGTTSKARLADESRSIQMGLTLLSVVSGICAALIIGTTLSVGVLERVRQFGQLRCIGASRGQLATFLAADALLLMVVGQAIGVGLGFGLSAILMWWMPQFFLAFKISTSSIMIALANGCVATVFGSLIPMWQVTRVTPMAAVTSAGQRAGGRRIGYAALIGLVLVVVQPMLWWWMPSREAKFVTYTRVGIPMIFLGYTLLGPMLLSVFERFGARTLGLLMGIKPSLLRHTWSRTPWRAGAMIAALMIGVTLFTAVRGRGESILSSWVFPSKFPDLFLYSAAPVSPQRIELLRKDHPQINDVTALAAFPVRMPESVFKVGEVLSRTNTTFIAVDPQSFGNMVEMDFIQGDRATAYSKLAEGNYVFVSKEFYIARQLGVGDKLKFIASDGKTQEFTIAAVVASNGMDMVKSYFDMRAVVQETSVSSVLGNVDDARKYFRLRDVNLLLANVHASTANNKATGELRDKLLSEGFQSASSVEMKSSVKGLIRKVVDTMSIIAVGALCVASLGVANMVIASVHARRFEFGVLRAIGAGRWQLVRLVLAEVTLIGLVAGILGAGAGLHFTYMGTLVDRTLVGFPTHFLRPEMLPRVLIGASFVGIACGLTIILAWLASLIPAIRGAFTAQRILLAGGRG